MEDTMRDLLSKLDALISETALRDKDDLEAKRQALQDLQMDPIASKDPEISQAIVQRKADLEKEAKAKGFDEDVDFDKIRKDAESHIKKSIDKQSDDRIAKLKADREKESDSFMSQVGKKIIGGIKGAAKGFSGKENIEEDIYQIGDSFGISFSEDFEIGTEIVDILEDGIVVDLDDTALEYLSQNGFSFEEIQIGEEKKKGLDGKACWKGYRYAGTKMKGGRRVDNCVKVSEEDDVEESGLQYYTGKKKYGKDGMAALAAAGREGASEEELGRIKDKYKKEGVEEGVSYSTIDPKIAEMMLAVYKKASRGVEKYRDEEGADRIFDTLKDFAREHKVLSHFESLLNNARNSAHMDFDTNPGHFKNWFPYVGEHLESFVKRLKELGKLEDEPDFEVEKEDIELEAEYQGRKVPLGKPMAGDVKKSKVYVRGPKGNVVKVNFGDKKMRIKKSNPNRRKSFRARHNCANPGPRHKARYWSCRAW
jgi:hypothetical protein